MIKPVPKNPRADFWRDQKVSRADKVIARRALERDPANEGGSARHPVRQRAAAHTFWTQPHPWSDKASG